MARGAGVSRPRATAGYSLGNYAAMVAAGAISYEEALDVLVAVWRETERLGIRGAMGAVIGARREAVDAECLADLRERGLPVWIGNVNASTQFVLTGSAEGVAAALEDLRPRALSVLPLTMSWPIHSELMRPVAEAIAPVIAASADRSGIREVPVLRTGGTRRSRAARRCGGCSARRSAFPRSGRRRSRPWSPTATGSSSRSARARCSRRWCAGSTARRAAIPAGTLAAVGAAVDIVGAG